MEKIMQPEIQKMEIRFIEQRNHMIKEQMNSLKRLIEQTIDDFEVLKKRLELTETKRIL
tara:strand:- start:145 stop:321 length:177 start_codon:yes stop_codon:yes gene_type:complete